MYALTHLLLGWIIGNYSVLERRDRAIAIFVAMSPDLDVLGYVVDRSYYVNFHHQFFHSVLFCMIVVTIAILFSQERFRAGVAFSIAAGSHLVGDLVGTNWGMPLLWPISDYYFSSSEVLSENAVYGVINPFAAIIAIVLSLNIMYEFRRTPWEVFSVKWDRRFVNFLTLPFRRNCSVCSRNAFFLDENDNAPLCLEHVNWVKGDRIEKK